jgi:hypothetical protein
VKTSEGVSFWVIGSLTKYVHTLHTRNRGVWLAEVSAVGWTQAHTSPWLCLSLADFAKLESFWQVGRVSIKRELADQLRSVDPRRASSTTGLWRLGARRYAILLLQGKMEVKA